MYCVKCRKHTGTTDVAKFTAKNGRLMQRGICSVCCKVTTGFIKSGTDLFNPRTAKEGVDSTPLHDFLRKILQFFLVFLTLF